MIKKAEILQGLKVKVVKTGPYADTTDFYLDGYECLSGKEELLPLSEELVVTKLPHTKQGIHLVGVERVRDGKQGKVFYCDFVRRCEKV